MRRWIALGLPLPLVAVGLWIALRPTNEDRLAEMVAELRARGEPVTLAELEAPMPRDDQNGARDLDEALAWLARHEPQGDWERRIAGPWNMTIEGPWDVNAAPEQMAALRAYLVDLAPFFERVDRAAGKPEIAWPLPPRDTAARVIEHCMDVGGIQRVQRHLAARARAGATPAERLRALRSTLGIGARLRVRTAIGDLVAIVVFRGACRGLRSGLRRGTIDPRAARRELDDLLRTPWQARHTRMLRRSRAEALELAHFVVDGSMADLLGGMTPRVVERARRALRALARGRSPFGDAAPVSALFDDLRAFERTFDPGYDAHRMWSDEREGRVVQGPLLIFVPRVAWLLVHADVEARLARVALAAYEHRRVHGDWPAALADLAPLFSEGVPLDPFTGAPFVVERDGDVLVLSARPWEGILEPEDDPADHRYVWRLPPR